MMSKKISRTSIFIDRICSFTIAPIEQLEMPVDFYYRCEERHVPPPVQDHWESQRNRLFVNLTRQQMTWRLLRLASFINVPIFGLLLLIYFVKVVSR